MGLEVKIISIPVILIALTIHECAHGLVALWRGDDTAKRAGRLTLNPLVHLDIFGALMLLWGPFGWAKPVPVNPYNLRNLKQDMILVSAAGPVSNILCALLAGYVLRFAVAPMHLASDIGVYLQTFLYLMIRINLGLSFFNLLPIPPLDGSQILMAMMPRSKLGHYLQVMKHVPMIFFVAMLIEWGLRIPTVSFVLNPLFTPYYRFWSFLIFG